MEIDFENLVKEGQEFLKMRIDFKKGSNPSAGSPGYLISVNWITKYKTYIQYEQLRRNAKPEYNPELVHPGRITNSDFLET